MEIGDFVGAWKLSDFQIENAQGESRAWGRNMRGLLIYESGGRMSVSIIRDPAEPKPSDWEAMDDVLFYAGTFASPSAGIIEHKVEVATERDRLGQTLVRNVELNGDILQISNRTTSGGIAKLTWRRAP